MSFRPTHAVKPGWGYWNFTECSDGNFHRASRDEEAEPILLETVDQRGSTSKGMLAFFRDANGNRIGADERSFRPLD